MPKFNSKKTAQMIGLILNRNGGPMSKLKLIKILYLADRESLAKWGESMTGDKPFSMRHGPVLSSVLDNFQPESMADEFWSSHIGFEPEEHLVFLTIDPGNDELSDSEKKILDSVFMRFKNHSPGNMIDWCHANLPEWEDPGNTSIPIFVESILKAVGKNQDEINAIRREQREYDLVDELLGGH